MSMSGIKSIEHKTMALKENWSVRVIINVLVLIQLTPTGIPSCKAKGDNGGNCTFNVVNSCLYPGELVCKSDNKCSCSDTANTYWHATSCKAKGDNGGNCTFNVANSCLYPGELVSNSCLYPGELVCRVITNVPVLIQLTPTGMLHHVKQENWSVRVITNVLVLIQLTPTGMQHHVKQVSLIVDIRVGDNGGDCTFNVANSCLYPGELVCKSDNKCSCSDTANTYWHATSCKAKGDNGGNCTFNVANSCLYPGELVCKSDNKCSCSDTANTYWHATSCKARELVCKNDNKCSCSDTANTYWHVTSCKARELVCKSDNKCSCSDTANTYWHATSMTCKPMENLKVSNIQLETSSETYLVISWTAPPAAAAVEEYRFLVGGTSSEVSVGIQKGANVTGLTPGVMYNITVISVDSNSRPAVQKTSPAPVNQATSMF
ncbi:unnamed protein product [Mytilus edulis]|uniref:Fibronectin type-III domain-containing protein n=1 Tax=Mytilus edulis TaxID=6550 RepID=A0A8S3TPJ9_MYTED|nr:unnamed protein product [Mytilus edulis]